MKPTVDESAAAAKSDFPARFSRPPKLHSDPGVKGKTRSKVFRTKTVTITTSPEMFREAVHRHTGVKDPHAAPSNLVATAEPRSAGEEEVGYVDDTVHPPDTSSAFGVNSMQDSVPLSNRTLLTGIDQSPVNSSVGDEAYFSELVLLEQIGRGATGIVHKVIHRPSGKLYALKVIYGYHHKGLACEDILRDIEALRDVDSHPNIVRCHGARSSNGEIQVLLEYMDGGSLQGVHIQDEQRLSNMALQILTGLAHLHKRKVVHLDIKPSNLLMDSAGNIKIADRISGILTRKMGTGDSSSGTIAYMSPERINTALKPGDYDGCPGDVWSVGVCILEIYRGAFPYADAHWKQLERPALMFKILHTSPPQAPSSAPVEFRDFVGCCLQKDPSKRWTAAQLLRHRFVLQRRVSTKLSEPPLPLPAPSFNELDAIFTELDLTPTLRDQQTALSDRSMTRVILEAQNRWLRPFEILRVLENYEKFRTSEEPPHRPPSGSLFLFNRKVVRYFKRDGHDWRKIKDPRTGTESREVLKVGRKNNLHCYYARGEKNPNFQRRSFRVLNSKSEDIVLVHYREVTEGTQRSVSLDQDSATKFHSTITCGSNISSRDSSSTPYDAQYESTSQRETNIICKSERMDPTSVEFEKSDSTQHLEPQSHAKPTKCKIFSDKLPRLKVRTTRNCQGSVESFHGAEERKVEMNMVRNDRDRKEDVSMLSNPMEIRYGEDDEPDVVLMGSGEDSDREYVAFEDRPNSPAGTDHADTDSCYTDSDPEEASAMRARQKHRKLEASESGHKIQIPEIHNPSTPSASSEEGCFPVEMLTDANVDSKKAEPSRGHAQFDDILSMELFHQKSGDVVRYAEIQAIAKEIVRACGNDIHSLTLMSRALSGVSDVETWEYALDSLSLQHASCHSDSENLRVNVLKFSIELLEDDLSRECLKSFALRRGKVEVARASLIDSWISEVMLGTRSEGEKVIENLLDAKLLQQSENGELVKFLDLDRHVVDLIFQPDESCEFIMQGGLGLVEPPEAGEWERAKEICLMQNDISELPENPRCPSLSTLFLQRNHKLRAIPSAFFSRMPALEVLNLSRTRIKSLPDSLFELVSLKRLFLNDCVLLRTLPAKVGELKNLEVLDLEGTKLVGLPKEIEQLVNLTCLEFSILGSTRRKPSKEADWLIPSGVLSSLSRIEELNVDVGPDADWWDACVEDLVGELCSLQRLNTLKFYFPKVELVREFDATSLSHFRIVVGKHIGCLMSRLPPDIEFELERWDRYLKYVYGEGVLEDVVKVLIHADALFLDRHVDVKELSDLGKENLEQLRCCVLGECNELQALIHTEDISEETDRITLGSLEYLYDYYMKSLETVWKGPVQKGSLSALKSLTLRTCPKLTSIFTRDLLENLISLEELAVEDCPALTSLVSCEHPARSETHQYLPVLRKMSLRYLPELTSISRGLQVAPKVEQLSFYDCPKLGRLDLSLREAKRIRGERIWWEGLEWNGDSRDGLDDIFAAISESAVP